jgi:hypothetical protein
VIWSRGNFPTVLKSAFRYGVDRIFNEFFVILHFCPVYTRSEYHRADRLPEMSQ